MGLKAIKKADSYHQPPHPHSQNGLLEKNGPPSLVDQGVRLEQVAYLAGHDSLETTRRYTQPGEKDLRKAVQSISEKKQQLAGADF